MLSAAVYLIGLPKWLLIRQYLVVNQKYGLSSYGRSVCVEDLFARLVVVVVVVEDLSEIVCACTWYQLIKIRLTKALFLAASAYVIAYL